MEDGEVGSITLSEDGQDEGNGDEAMTRTRQEDEEREGGKDRRRWES